MMPAPPCFCQARGLTRARALWPCVGRPGARRRGCMYPVRLRYDRRCAAGVCQGAARGIAVFSLYSRGKCRKLYRWGSAETTTRSGTPSLYIPKKRRFNNQRDKVFYYPQDSFREIEYQDTPSLSLPKNGQGG
jgi:hypothetical protein